MDFLICSLRYFLIIGFIAILGTPTSLQAQFSPGKLAKSHENLEGLDNCAKCHSNNVRSSADPKLCRDCHEAIDIRMKNGTGLHGREKFDQCGKCHSDHLGKKFNLIHWKTTGESKEKFNHDLTGYKLEGGHIKVKCSNCHQPKNIKDPVILKEKIEFQKKTFLGLGTDCLACHKNIHGKMFQKKKCLDCHTMEKWKPAKGFDHNVDTRFTIRGKHMNLECSKCHKKGQPWELSPKQRVRNNGCITCHNDVHKGKFGRDCAKCHQEESFKKIKGNSFDHNKTKFPLKGMHADVNCNQCHKNAKSWVLTRFKRCNDCHDNFHLGEFTKTSHPEKCEDCHTVEGFTPANYGVKEHNTTSFQLKDAHLATPCAACHIAMVNSQNKVVNRKFKFAATDCISCHEDPHRKQVAKYMDKSGCVSCHSGASWSEIDFNHDITGYKLTGRHQKVACLDCHSNAFTFRMKTGAQLKIPDFSKRKKECFECHEDKHLGQFRQLITKENRYVVNCDKCHSTTDWFAEKFDHNSDSRFKLDGAHEKARCEACHPTQRAAGKSYVRYKPLGMDCRSCHGDKNMLE